MDGEKKGVIGFVKEKFKSINQEKLSLHLVILFGILFGMIFILNYFEKLPEIISFNLFFGLLVFFVTYFLTQKVKKIPEKKREKSRIVYYFSHLFLLSLVVIAGNQFLKNDFITENIFVISCLSIMFGFLTFYASRGRVEKEIENEKVSEEKAERKREREFGVKKFKCLKRFDFDYGVGKAWGDKKYFLCLFRALVSPFIFVGRLPYSLVRWMYKEGWGYSLGLIGVVVLGFVLRIILATKMLVAIDEIEATNLVSLGFLEYFKIGTSISGAVYGRTQIFNMINSIPYFFINNEYIRLRLMPIVFIIIFTFFSYFFIKKIFKSKKMSLLSIFLITFNWYVVSTSITARSYILFIFISFFMLYILIKMLDEKKIKKLMVLCIFYVFLLIVSYFEVHAVLSLHSVIIFLFVLIYKFPILKRYKKQLIIASIILFFSIVLIHLRDKTVLKYILKKFSFSLSQPYLDGYLMYISQLSYIFEIGLILVLVFVFSLIFSKNNFKWIFVSYILFLPLIQIFVFSGKNSYPRYLSYMLIPFILIFSNNIYIIYKSKINKIIFFILFFIFLFTSFFNIFQIYNEDLTWQPSAVKDWRNFLLEIPVGSIVISDYPSMINFYRPDISAYYLRHNLNDYATVDSKGLFIDETVYKNKNKKENKLFLDYVDKNIRDKYVILENQEYHYTTASPKIMSIEHLEKIIDESKDKKIYFLLSHNIYEKKYHMGAIQLYNFIFSKMKILNESCCIKDIYSNKKQVNCKKKVFTLGEISFNV